MVHLGVIMTKKPQNLLLKACEFLLPVFLARFLGGAVIPMLGKISHNFTAFDEKSETVISGRNEPPDMKHIIRKPGGLAPGFLLVIIAL